MLLILLSWLYIFFTAISFGIAFSKMIRLKQFDIVVTMILGLFSIPMFFFNWSSDIERLLKSFRSKLF